MKNRSRERWLVIGVGNTYRQDDGVGPYVARLLKKRATPVLAVTELSGEATALIEAWSGANEVALVDAVHAGATPGTVHRFDAHHASLITEWFHGSTHSLGVVQAIEMARSLRRLPARMCVFGIEGESFGWGIGLSERVERAAGELAELIVADSRRLVQAGLTGRTNW